MLSVAILAGGLATRLGSLTETLPKALLPVAGKPFLGHQLAKRSVDILTTTEDLPGRKNRIFLDGDKVCVQMTPTNTRAHGELNRRTKTIMRRSGFPLILAKTLHPNVTASPMGTVRIGDDPKRAPLDQYCRSFDHPNLYVVDASFFPSSGSLNPSLTIVAQSLRVAEKISQREFATEPHSVAP